MVCLEIKDDGLALCAIFPSTINPNMLQYVSSSVSQVLNQQEISNYLLTC